MFGERREPALTADALVVETEILKNLEQPLLLPCRRHIPAHDGNGAKELLRGESGETVVAGRFQCGISSFSLRLQPWVLLANGIGSNKWQDDVGNDFLRTHFADQLGGFGLSLAAEGKMPTPVFIAGLEEKFDWVAVAFDGGNDFRGKVFVPAQ